MLHNTTSEEYHNKYVGECIGCVICAKPTSFLSITSGYSKTCGSVCSGKYQWNNDSGLRREKFRAKMIGNTFSTGRPTGSKNKQEYPMTAAVMKRLVENPPPSWAGKKHKQQTREKQSNSRLEWFANGGKPTMAYKGKFRPKHPEKYNGNPTNIIYRSGWELKLMMYLDTQANVLSWSSEEVRIPYISPIDSKRHTYFPDFWVKKRTPEGKIEEMIIEVKPEAQMVEPKIQNTKGKRPTKQYIKEVYTWGINSAKWKAAEKFASDRGWKFIKLGAKDLGIRF